MRARARENRRCRFTYPKKAPPEVPEDIRVFRNQTPDFVLQCAYITHTSGYTCLSVKYFDCEMMIWSYALHARVVT